MLDGPGTRNSSPTAPMSSDTLGRLPLAMAASVPQPLLFTITGPITRADLPGLCTRVCALLDEHEGDVVLCDVGGVDPDAVTVDALARLQLAARRRGCQVRLRHASPALLEIVAFMGLLDVLPD